MLFILNCERGGRVHIDLHYKGGGGRGGKGCCRLPLAAADLQGERAGRGDLGGPKEPAWPVVGLSCLSVNPCAAFYSYSTVPVL